MKRDCQKLLSVHVMLRRYLWGWGIDRHDGTVMLKFGPLYVEIG